MKSLILISSLLIFIFISRGNDYVQPTLQEKPELTFPDVCPSSKDFNKTGLEEFLTDPDWSTERAETNTKELSVSQIILLTDPKNREICSKLNDLNQKVLKAKNSLGKPAFDLTYFKVVNFYFVIISRRPTNEKSIVTGVSYIEVYNQNLDTIQGYAF